MILRALALLVLLAGVSATLSWWSGAEVLAALGLMLTQAKVVGAKLLAVGGRGALGWLKAQGINFARVELAKRWVLKSLVPLLIGAANQRRIAAAVQALREATRARYEAMMAWYAALPRRMRILAIAVAMAATLVLAVTTMSLWLVLFSVQLPIWIIAAVSASWQFLWRYLQKLAFRTIAFMQLDRVWSLLRRQLPASYLERKRRFDYRIARMVVRRRRMTLAQLHAHKHGLRMRLALIAEYFRHARPDTPSAAEMKAMRATRPSRKEETPR